MSEVEIRFLICQDKMSRQFEFWLDISRILAGQVQWTHNDHK